MQETWVRSLGWEDPLEKGKAVFWPGEIHRLYSPWDRKESDMTEQLSLSLSHTSMLLYIEVLGFYQEPQIIIFSAFHITYLENLFDFN